MNTALEDPEPIVEDQSPQSRPADIETTQEEIEGYLTVKAVLRGAIDTSRVVMRDAKSYCVVLLDDYNRKPIARLHFNRKQKYVGLFDGEAEERWAITSLDELYDYKDRILATIEKYSE